MKCDEKTILIPHNDCDVVLKWPGGQTVTIQIRTSNADIGGYAGSLDIILPDDMPVTCWQGDNMEPSKCSHVGASGKPVEECNRIVKQIVAGMDDSWYDPKDPNHVESQDGKK
jgi:hypothetical protein